MTEENTAPVIDAGTVSETPDNTGGEGQEASPPADSGAGKTGDSLLDGLSDGEGSKFDFTSEEKPEGFPDDFWDNDNKKPNTQALYDGLQKQEKIAKDLRAKMGKGAHKPPEKAEQYTFETSEKAKEFIPPDDPVVAAAKEVAHKHGLSQEQYAGFMADISDKLVDLVGERGDTNSATNQESQEAYIKEQIKEIGPNGPQVLRALGSWTNELVADGTLTEHDAETLREEGLVSAAMVQAMNRLRSRMGGESIPTQAADDGLLPDAEIADKLAKAYESGDTAKIRKVEELLNQRRAAGRPEKLQF